MEVKKESIQPQQEAHVLFAFKMLTASYPPISVPFHALTPAQNSDTLFTGMGSPRQNPQHIRSAV
jgi:hypothetical protein